MFGKWYCDRDQIILVKLDVADWRPDCAPRASDDCVGGNGEAILHDSNAIEMLEFYLKHSMKITGEWSRKLTQKSRPLAASPSGDKEGLCQRISRNPAKRNASSWIWTLRKVIFDLE